MDWFGRRGEHVARHHVQVFIPSVDRDGAPIAEGSAYWVEECLKVLANAFGGATAFPSGRGAWRDPDRGDLVFDDTTIVFSYAAEEDLSGPAGSDLHAFLMRLGRDTRQGEVGIYIDGEYRGFRDFA